MTTLKIGVIKKAKGEYWGVLHTGDPLYHVWAQRRGTYKQAYRAAQSEWKRRNSQLQVSRA